MYLPSLGQLSKLRERSDQKNWSWVCLPNKRMPNESAPYNSSRDLTHACRGHDRELDNKLAKLRQRFEELTPLHQLSDDIQVVEKLLQQHAVALEESLRVTRETIKEGGRHLSAIKEIPEKSRKEARDFLHQDSPYAIADHQRQVAILQLNEVHRKPALFDLLIF